MKNSNAHYQSALAELYQLYRYLKEVFFWNELLTEPIITINYEKNNRILRCYHTSEKWFENSLDMGNKQINISAQHLNRPFFEIVETLMHEMCHQWADEKGIKDTSRNGSWHNKNLKKLQKNTDFLVKKMRE